jgi:hypothetical protein
MPSLPAFSIKTKKCVSPHVVILGAGASKAAFPKGDPSGRSVPLMAELIECLNIAPTLNRYGIPFENVDFESLYDDLISSKKYHELVQEIERCIYNYFSCLTLPAVATIYDYLVLSLREEDIIASFNWDPFLALAWQRNSGAVKLPKIVFLHGNVELGICLQHKRKDFKDRSCGICKKPLSPIPLLFPVRHKDYNGHPYIASEWTEFRQYLQKAYFLTIFGYSAPRTDVEARNLLLNSWKGNPIFELGQIDIIDIKPRIELTAVWKDFFCRNHFGISRTIWKSYLFFYPRRSCEALAMATLQQSPWHKNPFPFTKNLSRLQNWARMLWREEEGGVLSGKKCEFR